MCKVFKTTQVRFVLLHFAVLRFTDVVVFYKLKARTSASKKITIHSIAVVWDGAHSISEVGLYSNVRL